MQNLVGYSSSEDSDSETLSAQKAASKPAHATFDRSQPPKIRINLGPIEADDATKDQPDVPPAKRQRTGGTGTFGGLSSFLPAPKRSAGQSVSAATASGGSMESSKSHRAPFTLKTSSEAAFERNKGTAESSAAAEAALAKVFSKKKEDASSTATPSPGSANGNPPSKKPMWRPLSVQNPKKKAKKKAAPIPTTQAKKMNMMDLDAQTEDRPEASTAKPVKPKVSLFPTSAPESALVGEHTPRGEYKPMMLDDAYDEDEELPDVTENDASSHAPANSASTQQHTPATGYQNLESLYATLSESDRRQLFGRKGPGDISALGDIKVKSFNADAEYSANEEMRAKGEQQEVKAVRPIKPGKHSLRQLVNVAATQKDALEDSYARGASNKREGASKYGW